MSVNIAATFARAEPGNVLIISREMGLISIACQVGYVRNGNSIHEAALTELEEH